MSGGRYDVAIYHCCVKIISRGAGRSSVAAAAYRAAEKLYHNAVEAAAYRSGEELREQQSGKRHDYRRKGGVVHTEILLPNNAPREFESRGVLWNSVEKAEKRCDARTAREVELALPIEFNLQENIELVRQYIMDNFVSKGMIADFAIHDKNDGNPHSHIMLTTRNVSEAGFGGKNRDWDRVEYLQSWRESWARVCNERFQVKGLDVRIDHRTLEAQGIDREPTIHVGRSPERARLNEEIKRRNESRTPAAVAERMHELKERYLVLDREISTINQNALDKKNEARGLRDKADDIDERVKHIRENEKRLAELREERQHMGFFTNKKAIDEDIQRLEYMLTHNIATLQQKYYITPDEAPAKMRRLEYEAQDFDIAGEQLRGQIEPLKAERSVIEIEYQRHMLLSKLRPDWVQIQALLKQRSQAKSSAASVQEKIDRIGRERKLDEVVTESNFKAILQSVTEEQARKLTAQRNREREKERDRRRIHERWR